MFKENANTAFNNKMFTCAIIPAMHDQMKRLYSAAKAIRGIEGQSELARLLGELPQTLNNWEARGISAKGLLAAQERLSCDAIWLRDGTGEMRRSKGAANDDLGDMAELVALYARSSADERRAILDYARDLQRMSSRAGRAGTADNKG